MGLFFCTWVWMPDHVPSAIAIITNDRLQLHSSLIRWGCISPLKHSKKKYMKWHCKGHIVHLNVNIYWIKKLHYTNADMKLFTYKPVESSIAMLKSFSTCNEWKPIVNMVLYQVIQQICHAYLSQSIFLLSGNEVFSTQWFNWFPCWRCCAGSLPKSFFSSAFNWSVLSTIFSWS